MYSDIFGFRFICLSENDLEIITCNKSSVGSSIPKYTKLFVLDCKSLSSKFNSFNEGCYLLQYNFLTVLIDLKLNKIIFHQYYFYNYL